MTNDQKPVFPAGYEPPGFRRDDYLVTGEVMADNSPAPRKSNYGGRKTRVRPVDICFYCGDELSGRFSDVSVETGSAECAYSPSSMHELEELNEQCSECTGTGQCTYCDGLGCRECNHSGVCPVCDGMGTEPGTDDKLWDQDTYLGGYGNSGWDKPAYPTTTPDWLKKWDAEHGYKSYKPASPTWRTLPWSEVRSQEAAKSSNMFVRLYGRYRDAQEHYASCPVKRHWGPRGGAGLVPWTIAPDGEVYVLLSHRSMAVENGGTWSSFGGAIDKNDKSPFHAAVREAFEEVEGLPSKGHVTAEVARPCHACGWLYTTFLIQMEAAPVRVNRKAGSGWETSEVKWVKLGQVQFYKLHPGFEKTWPELRQAIEKASR